MNHRRRALALTGAFACASAAGMHTVMHGVFDRWAERSGAHLVELIVSLGFVVLAAAAARSAPTDRERRRRLALIRAAQTTTGNVRLIIGLAQATVVGALYAVEGSLHGGRDLAIALASGALAFAFALYGLRARRRPAIALLRWLSTLLAAGFDCGVDGVALRRRRPLPLGTRARRHVRFRGPPLLLPTR